MSEFMGNIVGTYDAKEKGFCPGASSLHSCMSGHGPEAEVFAKASAADLKPMKISPDGLAFMFETCYIMKLTEHGADKKGRDVDYHACWNGLTQQFTPRAIAEQQPQFDTLVTERKHADEQKDAAPQKQELQKEASQKVDDAQA